MRTVRNRLKGGLLVTVRVVKRWRGEPSTKVTERNSTTSGTTQPEAWIMSGLVLSVVAQIVAASLRIKDTSK